MQSALQKVPGVSSVQVDLTEGKAIVQVEKGKVTEAQLVNAVNKSTGMHEYSATVVKAASKPAEENSDQPQSQTQQRKRLEKKPNVRR